MRNYLSTALLLLITTTLYAENYDKRRVEGHEVIHLWKPEKVPMVQGKVQDPNVVYREDYNYEEIRSVTDPRLIVYSPQGSGNGRSVIICPGGGYSILSADKEGYEPAEWLAKHGYTAFVLQYRVPNQREAALKDIQRAIRTVRSHCQYWGIHSNEIGVMGFSAGAHLCERAVTLGDQKEAKPIDKIDQFSAKPNYTILIYPAYMDKGPNHSLSPDLKVNSKVGPTFVFQACDDPYGGSSIAIARALRLSNASVEIHMVPKGGHGYGMRPNNIAGSTWPSMLGNWLKNLKHFI